MEGIISNYRRAMHHTQKRQMIVKINSIDTKPKAEKLIGKTVIWTSPAKKEIKGKITFPHGANGAVRVQFEKGLPGQSYAQKVKIE